MDYLILLTVSLVGLIDVWCERLLGEGLIGIVEDWVRKQYVHLASITFKWRDLT